MIATPTYSTQLSRFAAKKLVRNISRRSPASFTTSASASPSVASSLLWTHSGGSSSFNSNNHIGEARAYSNTQRHTYQPMGDLFKYAKEQGRRQSSIVIDDNFVGKSASIRRVFGPASNAQALLTCGGDELAQQASFDPNYETAKGWIRSRPVGPAVLSSTLISGLVGALIEASFPQTVPVNNSMNFLRPLIVGMEVSASIRVEAVRKTKRESAGVSVQNGGNSTENTGYEIMLSTQVTRVQDDITIAEGHHTVWIPGYL